MTSEAIDAIGRLSGRQLGLVFEDARVRRAMTLEQMCERLDHQFTPVTLAMVEEGCYPISEDELLGLLLAYGIQLEALLPRVRPSDDPSGGAGEGRVDDLDGPGTSAPGDGGPIREVLGDRAHVEDRPGDVLLTDYLMLVYAMRGQEPGTTMPLREDDVEVLARSLGQHQQRVQERLVELMADPTIAHWADA